jgi:hypothetical protein
MFNSMQRKCVLLHEANGGHTQYWLASLPFLKVSVTNKCPSVFPVGKSIDKGLMNIFWEL